MIVLSADLQSKIQRIYELSPDDVLSLAIERLVLRFPQVEMPVDNQFCEGVYARTLTIPAGTILTGAIHKAESFFVVRSGTLLVTTPNGPIQVGPGFMIVTKPGEKRIGISLSDVLVTTFHANPDEIRDEDKIWEAYTLPPPQALIDEIDALLDKQLLALEGAR